jgi:membrane complex biogenesis BtpA family protein
MKTRFEKIFPNGKPIIAMAHLPAIPGTPLYNAVGGLDEILDVVREDLEILLQAGFDAVLFCNEGDRPYVLQADYAGVATMTRVITELAPRDRPFGVDYLFDAQAALAIAVATDASFIRAVTTGFYESDMGSWSPNAGTLLRERKCLDANKVAVFSNITPEFASSIGERSISLLARSVAVSSMSDVLLISGPMASVEPDLEVLRQAKDAVDGEVPVFVNTGVKSTNVASFLQVADGVIVGSDLKYDGYTWNRVDRNRVKQFLDATKQ